MEITIQNLLLPQARTCTEEPMYFYREDGQDASTIIHEKKADALLFRKYGKCTFSTYFNGLTIKKWKKYTNIGNVSLVLMLKGHFEVDLLSVQATRLDCGEKVTCEFMAGAYKSVLNTTEVNFQNPDTITIPYQSYDSDGILSFSLRAMDDDAVFLGGYYAAEVKEENLKDTDIAINICTFRREDFILRNLDILREQIIENENSPLCKHLQVYISDNGQTLPRDQLNSDSIHIVPNKNVGGAGGFTRGLMEILEHQKDFPATHALMMDDDIVICPESLFRTYALLRCRKDEYEDMFVGGAMMRLDSRSMQVESGASWNAGKLVSNKQGLDMCYLADVLMNEVEEYTEYNAWWYCCTPMRLVSRQNLPMPIFIRGDDLEFGLRNMKTLVLMNGICVWHEPFENKYSSTLYYYILRNLLYDNALHFPKYSIFSFLKKMYGSVFREVVYYRYKNVDLLLRGVNDFFDGVDFLKRTDGEKLHKEIMAAGYKAVPVDQLKDAAFRLPSYYASLEQGENSIHRILRMLTLNGFLLPAKRYKGTAIQCVGMANCRPINFYRQLRVLNYEEMSGKGFVTRKSYRETFRCVGNLIAMTFKSLVHFDKAKKNVAQNREQITNADFWSEYLDLRN